MCKLSLCLSPDIYIYIYVAKLWACNEKRKRGLPVVDLDVVLKPRFLRTLVFTLLLN